MHSLVFLCARRLLSHLPGARRALGLVPSELYPVLFRAAILDGRTLALQELVTSWPFPVLSFRSALEFRPVPAGNGDQFWIQAVLLAVGANLRRQLEGPESRSSQKPCRLRILDMTDLGAAESHRGPAGMSLWSSTVALAKACLEISNHPAAGSSKSSSKRSSKRLKIPSCPSPSVVEIHADLFVNATSFGVLRDALQNPGPLRLRCRDFHAEELSVARILSLLESLDPSGIRRVELRFNNLGLSGLCVVLPRLAAFTHLLSLKLPYSNVDVRRLNGADSALRRFATHLAELKNLKELNLGSSRLSGKLRQLLGDLETPLESLELAFCSLLPADLTFLSQSRHTPALKKLDLSGHDLSQNLFQPFQNLLEETAPSLLHLDLLECRLTDSRLEALLPVLCRCSRLRCLGLFGNPVTVAGLKVLVRKTAVLPDLRLVVYPYPVDCSASRSPSSHFLEDEVDQELAAEVNADLRRILVSSGRADAVWTTSLCHHGALDYFTT